MPEEQGAREARIGRLEQDLRRTRLAASLGLLVGFVVVLSAWAGQGEQVVRADVVELLGEKGGRQATLSADSAGFVLTLLDEKGRPSSLLRFTPEPWLSVETGRGREVAGLGFPKVRNLRE
jgi:hypothetical protein